MGGEGWLDITRTQRHLRDFANAREWSRFHSPKNLVMALASEAGELLDLFRWVTEEESRALSEKELAKVALELGDIQIFVLRVADVLGISLSQAVEDKLALNEEKYPIELSRDNATKYSRRPTADQAIPPER